jgi:molecular chaperone HscB
MTTDYFSVFGLPRRLQVDERELQRRFYELSREHHPDFHQGADAETQEATLQRSALVNRAYRALRDPLSRLEHVLALEAGGEAAAGRGGLRGPDKPTAPRNLLEEMLEVQEALEEARAAGMSGDALERVRAERDRLVARRAADDAAVAARAAEWDTLSASGGDRGPLLAWFRERLARRAYLGTVIDDLGEALGEEPESARSARGVAQAAAHEGTGGSR